MNKRLVNANDRLVDVSKRLVDMSERFDDVSKPLVNVNEALVDVSKPLVNVDTLDEMGTLPDPVIGRSVRRPRPNSIFS